MKSKYYIPKRVVTGYKYKDNLEMILDRYYNLKMDNENFIYIDDNDERNIVNGISCYSELFQLVYWGVKNGMRQYKICVRDEKELNKIGDYKLYCTFGIEKIPCTEEEYNKYLKIESNFN